MKIIHLIIGCLAIFCASLAIYFVLGSEYALITHPQGVIAKNQLSLIVTNILLMLVIAIPTFIILFFVVWKYHKKNDNTYDPNHSYGLFGELILWVIPSVIIAVMMVITWNATHELDPYKPITNQNKPLKIQVVALNWKWLFLYPEQGIATLNYVQFPANTPIHFSLSADGSPMNSFWIPQLSGQIYSMTGMVTTLYLMADQIGEYAGKAVEINGEGYAGMTFVAKSTSQADFDKWVESVKHVPHPLTSSLYDELVKPSQNMPVAVYSDIEKDLFDKIVMKY